MTTTPHQSHSVAPLADSQPNSRLTAHLRPSRQSNGGARAVAFVAGVDRRSAVRHMAREERAANVARSSNSALTRQSPHAFANPNRSSNPNGTARWGTVAVNPSHVDAVLDARAQRDHALAQEQQARINAARKLHPAVGVSTDRGRSPSRSSRRSSENQQSTNVVPIRRSVPDSPSRRSVSNAPVRRTGTESMTVSAGAGRFREREQPPVREQTGLMPSAYASAEGTPNARITRFGVRSTSTGTATGPNGRTEERSFARSSVRSGRELSPSGAQALTPNAVEIMETSGATALAPRHSEKTRRESATRETRQESAEHLRVALPPRRFVKKSVAGSVIAVSSLMILLVVASAAIVLHARLAKNQMVLDDMRIDVATEERTNERLRVEVAQLEAPTRILLAAQQLGLEPAERIEYSSATQFEGEATTRSAAPSARTAVSPSTPALSAPAPSTPALSSPAPSEPRVLSAAAQPTTMLEVPR